jgi:DHA1 family bicyclomycin/chloramphenicol resistance-like MFS transporter
LRLKVANAAGRPTLGITLLLASLSMVSPLSTDTFLPSLPTIAAQFHLTPWEVQQIITAYMLPFAFFALVHGPLSDALGRRRVVIWGLVLYTIGSVGCFLAPTFGTLLAFRVLQGMAAGIGPSVSRAVVRDLFEGAAAQKLMSSMVMVFSLAPAIAPVLGGWVHVALGWRWVFGMLVVLGIGLLLACSLLFPETHPPSKRSHFHPVSLFESAWHVAMGPAFSLLAFSAALAMSSLFIYIGSAPTIILQRWHLAETQFHYLFIPVVLGLMSSSYASGRIAGRVQRATQLKIGFATLYVSAAIMVVAHLLVPELPIFALQLYLFVLASGAQLVYPVLTLEMIDMHPLARGAAASVQTFIALGVGALAMGMLAPVLHGNLALMAGISLGGSVLAWLLWRAATALRLREA